MSCKAGTSCFKSRAGGVENKIGVGMVWEM